MIFPLPVNISPTARPAGRIDEIAGRLFVVASCPLAKAQTRCRFSGNEMSSRPRASATAFVMAAGVSIELPSPIPFAPSALAGEGVSTWPISICGTSTAVGQR